MGYANYISINLNIRFGKPCLKETRISVRDVLGWLSTGMSHEEIISNHPELSENMIRACLAFAANREIAS